MTEVGSTLVFDISHTGGAMHIGGTKASSLDFYARAIAVGFPPRTCSLNACTR